MRRTWGIIATVLGILGLLWVVLVAAPPWFVHDLADAHLEQANLHGTPLEGADLHGTRLEGADLYGARLEGGEPRRRAPGGDAG
jgi:uncharacterized protein YjbI with pentapeptide repeats